MVTALTLMKIFSPTVSIHSQSVAILLVHESYASYSDLPGSGTGSLVGVIIEQLSAILLNRFLVNM
jgi:hypothetical protein